MTNLFRVRTQLTGFPGGPGLATMYFLDVATAHTAVHELWLNFATAMPPDVHIQVLGGADTINEVNGDLTGSVPTAQPEELVGSAVGAYAAPIGALARWSTDTIVNHHRLRGRTFVVPLTTLGGFDTGGQLLPSLRVSLETPCAAFVVSQATSFVVWSRPSKAKAATATRAAVPARDGSHALVTGSGISPKAVVLRSRRD